MTLIAGLCRECGGPLTESMDVGFVMRRDPHVCLGPVGVLGDLGLD